MYIPDNSTLTELGASIGVSDISNPNGPVSAICSFPLSGQYGPGARMLYYALVVICIFATHVEWMRGASLAAALLFPAVAAVHALIISSTSQSGGAVDLDIFGTFQLCAIGVLCVPITVRYSKTYFETKGRNMVFVWTALNLAGLLSLIIAFWRANPTACLDASGSNVTYSNFWTSQSHDAQKVCFTPRFSLENGCDITTIIRQDSSNPSQWIPAPRVGMTLNTATLLCAACSIPAILSLVSVWQKVMHINWLKRWTRPGRRGSIDVNAPGDVRDSPKPMNAEDEKKIADSDFLTPEQQQQKQREERWVEKRIKLFLGLVERIVFSVCIIAIVVLGEINFWSREMRSGVEPITSIGQWGPIVGAALAVFGSLFTVLTSGDGDKDSLFSDTAEDPHEVPADVNTEGPDGEPVPADVTPTADGGTTTTVHNADGTTTTIVTSTAPAGHRAKVNKGVFKLLKVLGTPGADRFADEVRTKKYLDYPMIPGEKERNRDIKQDQTRYRARQETMLSRRASLASIISRRASFSNDTRPTMDSDESGFAGPSGSRINPIRSRTTSNGSLAPPSSSISQGLSNADPSLPSSSPGAGAQTNAQRTHTDSSGFLAPPRHQDTLPPQRSRADSLAVGNDSVNHSRTLSVPEIVVVSESDSDHSSMR